MKPFFTLLLFALVISAQAPPAPGQAQVEQDAPERIEPDRRDFTTGTGIVPKGSIQIETGISRERRGSSRDSSFGEALVRVPVAERAEVRFRIPTYRVQRDLDGRRSGADDASLEARFLLVKREKSEFGVQLTSVLPTGSRRVAERRYQPGAILAANFTLSSRASLLVDLGASRASEEGQRFTQAFAASSFRYDASDKVNLFAEVYAFNKEEAGRRSQKFANAGAAYFLRPNLALDASFGLGLGNRVGGPDYLYSSGLSYLF